MLYVLLSDCEFSGFLLQVDTLDDVVDEFNGPAGVQALKELLSKLGNQTANQTLSPFLNQIEDHAKKTKNDIDSVKSNWPSLLLQKFSKQAVDVEFIR